MVTWPPTAIRSISLGGDLDDPGDFDGYLGGFKLAGLARRVVSMVVDLIVFLLPVIILEVISSVSTPADVCQTGFGQTYCQSGGAGPDFMQLETLLAFVALFLNTGLLNGLTGQSIGKRMVGTHLALPVDLPGAGPCFVYVGVARSLARYIAHAFDIWTLGFGFLRASWHSRRQTFADSAMGTVVIAGPITLRAGKGPKL